MNNRKNIEIGYICRIYADSGVLSSSAFCGGKYPPPSAWYHASAFLTILSGPLAQWAESGADNVKAVS